ncbi:hypothetical protein HDV05_007945, partial [Chytridiales sp. JEL 0842]
DRTEQPSDGNGSLPTGMSIDSRSSTAAMFQRFKEHANYDTNRSVAVTVLYSLLLTTDLGIHFVHGNDVCFVEILRDLSSIDFSEDSVARVRSGWMALKNVIGKCPHFKTHLETSGCTILVLPINEPTAINDIVVQDIQSLEKLCTELWEIFNVAFDKVRIRGHWNNCNLVYKNIVYIARGGNDGTHNRFSPGLLYDAVLNLMVENTDDEGPSSDNIIQRSSPKKLQIETYVMVDEVNIIVKDQLHLVTETDNITTAMMNFGYKKGIHGGFNAALIPISSIPTLPSDSQFFTFLRLSRRTAIVEPKVVSAKPVKVYEAIGEPVVLDKQQKSSFQAFIPTYLALKHAAYNIKWQNYDLNGSIQFSSFRQCSILQIKENTDCKDLKISELTPAKMDVSVVDLPANTVCLVFFEVAASKGSAVFHLLKIVHFADVSPPLDFAEED